MTTVALEVRETGFACFLRAETHDVAPASVDDTAVDLFASANPELDARVLVDGALRGYRNPAMAAGSVLMHPLPLGAGFVEMVYVPPGTFLRGCDTSSWAEERPEALVTLTRGFFVAKYPTLVREFHAFVEATGHVTTAEREGDEQTWRSPDFEQADDHPVVCVSWHDSVAFGAWAGLRLPTEAEWEYAARGTYGRTYPWGDELPDDTRLAWSGGDTRRSGTAPVGEHPAGASPFGVHDLAGTVLEWAADWYDEKGYGTETVDPTGARQGTNRAIRGGCWWDDHAADVRAAYRYWYVPDGRFDSIGFRAARWEM
jgi:formylglycine-generating enzyme required for sulfatase activity